MSFTPADVPEVAAGYWWDATRGVTGLGTSGFTWAEQNGHTSFDLVQSTTAAQPSSVVSNRRTAMHYDVSPTVQTVAASGSVLAGWTGSTYIAGWWRFPNGLAGTVGTSTTTMLSHNDFSTHRRFLLGASPDPDSPTDPNTGVVQISLSANGTSNATVLGIDVIDAKNWHFYECFMAPSAASGSRRFFRVDLAIPSINNFTSDTTFTSLANPSAPLSLGSRSNIAATQVSECAWCVYANGIPSDANRAKLFSYAAPVQVTPRCASGSVASEDAVTRFAGGRARGAITEH